MLMECENWPEMNHAGHYGGRAIRWPHWQGRLLVVACRAKRDEFDIRAGRYLSLLQDARRCTGCHAGRHRRVTILAAEEIATHGVAGVAPAFFQQLASQRVIELPALHDW